MDFLSGRRVEDLFENIDFLNAIRRNDIHEIKGKIGEICDFHIEGELSSPLIKLAKTKWPDRYKKQRQEIYRRFNSAGSQLISVRTSIGGFRSRGSVRTIIDTNLLRVPNRLASLPVHPTRLESRSLHRPLVLSRTSGEREVRVCVLQDGGPSRRSMERHEE